MDSAGVLQRDDGIGAAGAGAQVAAGAGGTVYPDEGQSLFTAIGFDNGFAPVDQDGRAAHVKAVAAAGAAVAVHGQRRLFAVAFGQHTGLVGDNDRGLRLLDLLPQRLEQGGQLVRVDLMNALRLDPQGLTQLSEVDLYTWLAMDVEPGGGRVLTSGHADGAVIQQQQGDVA